MENATITALTRQIGLSREMAAIANNVANMSTTGYRRETVGFSEFVQLLGADHPSLSMAAARVARTDLSQGTLTATGGEFDLAIEGDGFFLVATPRGDRLTRAGAFTVSPEGTIVTQRGEPVLDEGGAEIPVPPGIGAVAIGADGTLSIGGTAIGRIGLWQPAEGARLIPEAGTVFRAEGEVEAATSPGTIRQGFLEGSNADPVREITRMIEVQRGYELAQSFLDKEDERMRSAIRTLGR